MRYVRIYADSGGESRFEDVAVELAPVEYAPPSPPIGLAEALPVTRCLFFEVAPGWFGDWHTTPRRQLCFVLGGTLEVQTSAGGGRAFGPGALVLLEDTTGRGHTTRCVSDGPASGAFVPLAG
jgi:hypothetical protein